MYFIVLHTQLLEKLKELSAHRVRNRNIAATIEMLSMCIPGNVHSKYLFHYSYNKAFSMSVFCLQEGINQGINF